MNRLWAPWRQQYIEQDPKDQCIFCLAVESGIGFSRLVLDLNEHSLVLLNRFPYSNGHLMVAPRHHAGELNQVPSGERLSLLNEVNRSIEILKKLYKPEGFNVGMNIGRAAGAGFPGHLHIHIVPRWNGDINFMPALSEVKVISAHLEKVYNDLEKHYR